MATFLITGANRGIGLELATQLTERGDTAIGACRAASDELRALDVEVIEGVDVTSDDGIAALKRGLAGREVDVLINNAGLLSYESLADLDLDRIRRQFEINALGPLRVTAAVVDHIPNGGHVVIITSRMGSVKDNTSGGYYGYRMSKAAVNMAGRSLSVDLRPRGISVRILHPGLVATQMTQGNGIPTQESVGGLLERIDEMNIANTGEFHHANGEPLPW